MNESTLTAKIMRRVYALYVLRRLTSIEARLILLALSCITLFLTVSVPNVVQNMPPLSNIVGVAQFFLVAITNTQFIVQALISVGIVLSGWTLYDALRTLAEYGPRRLRI